MADYTTLQYHLANKTHIEFIIKLISGIIGVALNIILIPKMGLVGVGIATFAANFLYLLLSLIIVLPNLNLYFPKKMLLRMIIAFIPSAIIWYSFKILGAAIPAAVQMGTLLFIFYIIYYIVRTEVIKSST